MEKISKQLERQANQLTRIEKVILPLQRSVNKIDKQSNTIKQLYTKVTQLQRQIRPTKSQGAQKKRGKNLASRSKKRRSLKRR
jgi:archaellum component FlaC